MIRERRQYDRVDVRVPVRFTVDNLEMTGHTQNLSEGGSLVQLDDQAPSQDWVGSRATVCILLDNLAIDIPCKILRIEEGVLALGFSEGFSQLALEKGMALRRMLRQAESK